MTTNYNINISNLRGNRLLLNLRGITYESVQQITIDYIPIFFLPLKHTTIAIEGDFDHANELELVCREAASFSIQIEGENTLVQTHFGSSFYLFSSRNLSASSFLINLYRITNWIGFHMFFKPVELLNSIIIEGNFSYEEIKEIQTLTRSKINTILKEQVLEFFRYHAPEELEINSYVVVTKSAFKGERALIKENFPKTKESRVEFVNFGRGITFVLPWEFLTSTGEKYSEDNKN